MVNIVTGLVVMARDRWRFPSTEAYRDVCHSIDGLRPPPNQILDSNQVFTRPSRRACDRAFGLRNQAPVTYTKKFLTVPVTPTIVIDNFAGTYTVLWRHKEQSYKARGVPQRLEGRNEVAEVYQEEPPIAGVACIFALRAWSNSASRYRNYSWNRD